MNNQFEYQGNIIKPNKNGIYNGCPFGCDKNTGYPRKSWKTEKGIKKHLLSCSMSPEKVSQRNTKKESDSKEYNKASEKLLLECTYKVGDTISYIGYNVTKPIRDARGRKVRYEEERKYFAKKVEITSITTRPQLFNKPIIIINDRIRLDAIEDDYEEAIIKARSKDAAYRKGCEEASYFR